MTLSLHNGDVPVRTMGLGSKRLLAVGSQLKCIKVDGAILLVDEIEYALEPYRIKHLVRRLKEYTEGGQIEIGQIIMTTHSPAVLEELGAKGLFVVHSEKNKTHVTKIAQEAQGTVRHIPDAFLAPRIIVCEGATEVGLLRAFENKVIKDTKSSFALNSVVFVDGGGSDAVGRANHLCVHGYDVCLFLDSDKKQCWSKSVNEGVKVICWDGEVCTEQAIVNDLPHQYLAKFLDVAVGLNGEQCVLDNLNNKLDGTKIDCVTDILKNPDCRKIVGDVCNSKDWFKQVGKGEALGEFLFNNAFDEMSGTDFHTKLVELRRWAIDEE